MKANISEIKQKILPILLRYDARRVGLFGSCIRDDMGEKSDIDILVEIGKKISLLDFVGVQLELEEVLGRKVDLVEYNTIKPLLKKKILKEQITLFNLHECL